jgi:hypothetical protein
MRWLPEYGVGIIAFGNRTYTNWTAVSNEAFRLLVKTGGLQPRVPQPAPILVERRDQVSRLVMQWDDRLADSIASVNLFLDRSRDRRKAEIARLQTEVGPCRAGTSFDLVENGLRGQWTMPCDRGAIHVAITLAPTWPPTVQFLEVSKAPATPPPPRGLCPSTN